MVSVGQESRSGLSEWFWLGVCREIVVEILAWAAVIWRLDWCWWVTSKELTHMAVKLVLVVGRRLLSLTIWTSLEGFLRVLMMFSWILPEKWSKREWSGSHNVFYDIASEVTLCHVYDILMVTQVSPSICGRGPHKSVNTRRWESSWRLATTHMKSNKACMPMCNSMLNCENIQGSKWFENLDLYN